MKTVRNQICCGSDLDDVILIVTPAIQTGQYKLFPFSLLDGNFAFAVYFKVLFRNSGIIWKVLIFVTGQLFYNNIFLANILFFQKKKVISSVPVQQTGNAIILESSFCQCS